MIDAMNKLGDRILDALLPKASAAAADCICCPGGQHSVRCDDDGNLYVLSCCCVWQFVCGPNCLC
jgi:hypothetical protein